MINLKASLVGGTIVMNLLKERVPIAVARAAKAAVVGEAYKIFEKSLSYAPVDTGKLVRSATLRVNNRVYARGEGYSYGGEKKGARRVQTWAIPTDVYRGGKFGTRGADDTAVTKLKAINISISYSRIADEPEETEGEEGGYQNSYPPGTDIALALHEDLLPYGKGPAHARAPGTGGKWLERALNEASRTDVESTFYQVLQAELDKIKKR